MIEERFSYPCCGLKIRLEHSLHIHKYIDQVTESVGRSVTNAGEQAEVTIEKNKQTNRRKIYPTGDPLIPFEYRFL